MRAALRSERICLFIADESLMEEEDEIPEDADFMLMPPTAIDDAEEGGEERIFQPEDAASNDLEKKPKEETQTDGEEQESVSGEGKEMNWMNSEEAESFVRQKSGISQTGMRSVPWNAEKLCTLAKELEMSEEALAARCVESAAGGILSIWEYERDSFSGECVFLLNEEEETRLWIGCDRLCLTWNLGKVSKEKAAGLLHGVLRKLEKPTLLIYDKECEGK